MTIESSPAPESPLASPLDFGPPVPTDDPVALLAIGSVFGYPRATDNRAAHCSFLTYRSIKLYVLSFN